MKDSDCKERVKVSVRDPATLKNSIVEGFFHPKGCLGARFSHLDLPFDALEGGLLKDLAAKGGARVWVEELGGCYEVYYEGVSSVILCFNELEARRGWGYVASHRPGWVYLVLPSLRPKRVRARY
jgi:hypothetical protein